MRTDRMLRKVGWGVVSCSVLASCGPTEPHRGSSAAGTENLASLRQPIDVGQGLVIRQVYLPFGTAPTFKRLYVELFNKGSEPVSLKDLTLQLGTWTTPYTFSVLAALPGVTLSAGQSYLVATQRFDNSAYGPLEPGMVAPDLVVPAPPVPGTPPPGSKFALVRSETALACGGTVACSTADLAKIVDLVGIGIGAGASPSEGSPKACSNSAGALAPSRMSQGTQDTNGNSVDFGCATPEPRNGNFPLQALPEPASFALAVNGEGASFACEDFNAANCLSKFRYQEGGRSYFTAESAVAVATSARDDRRVHRHPTQLIDSCGAVNAPGKCAGDENARGLLFEGFENPTGGNPDRMELTVSQSGGNEATVLQFGEWRYLRFFIRPHQAFGQPTPAHGHSALITQVWQRDSNEFRQVVGGAIVRQSVGPAFSVDLVTAGAPEGKINAVFSYRNDDVSECPAVCQAALALGHTWDPEAHPEVPSRVPFWAEPLDKDKWVGFVIAMKPVHKPQPGTSDPTARGAILIWKFDDVSAGLSFGPGLNTGAALNYDANDPNDNAGKNRFHWGYRPERPFSSPPDSRGGFTNRFDVRVGIYRSSRQYSTLWFDHVKLTNHEQCLPGTTEITGPCTVSP